MHENISVPSHLKKISDKRFVTPLVVSRREREMTQSYGTVLWKWWLTKNDNGRERKKNGGHLYQIKDGCKWEI